MQTHIRRGADLHKIDLLFLQQTLLLQGAGEHLDLLQHRLGADHLHIIILHMLRCCSKGDISVKGLMSIAKQAQFSATAGLPCKRCHMLAIAWLCSTRELAHQLPRLTSHLAAAQEEVM